MPNAQSLKAKIKAVAKSKDVFTQVVLQNYMFERLLERILLSEYRNNLKTLILGESR